MEARMAVLDLSNIGILSEAIRGRLISSGELGQSEGLCCIGRINRGARLAIACGWRNSRELLDQVCGQILECGITIETENPLMVEMYAGAEGIDRNIEEVGKYTRKFCEKFCTQLRQLRAHDERCHDGPKIFVGYCTNTKSFRITELCDSLSQLEQIFINAKAAGLNI